MSIKTQVKERLGDPILCYLIIILLRIFESIFPKGKQSSTEPDIPDREALPLGPLDYLHVGTSSRGFELKPRMVPGHGWVECGTSQVIRLTDLRSTFSMFLLILWT